MEGQFLPGDNPNALAKAAMRSKKPFYEHPLFMMGIAISNFLFMTIFIGWVNLWMDNHNDVRYKPRTEVDREWAHFMETYRDNRIIDKQDRDSIRELAKGDKQDLKDSLARLQAQLDTLSADMKTLLRKSP